MLSTFCYLLCCFNVAQDRLRPTKSSSARNRVVAPRSVESCRVMWRAVVVVESKPSRRGRLWHTHTPHYSRVAAVRLPRAGATLARALLPRAAALGGDGGEEARPSEHHDDVCGLCQDEVEQAPDPQARNERVLRVPDAGRRTHHGTGHHHEQIHELVGGVGEVAVCGMEEGRWWWWWW